MDNLRAEVEELRRRLSTCQEEKARLEEALKSMSRLAEESGVEGRSAHVEELARAGRTALEKTKERIAVLEERLRRCVRRRRVSRILRMAYLARLGMEKKVFSPGRTARDTGMRYWIVYKDIRLLERLGILRRIRWGLYMVREGVRMEDLEDEIARRLAVNALKGR